MFCSKTSLKMPMKCKQAMWGMIEQDLRQNHNSNKNEYFELRNVWKFEENTKTNFYIRVKFKTLSKKFFLVSK